MEKICISCQVRKPIEAFYKHPRRRDGRASICMDCHKSAMKQNRRNNPAVRERDVDRAKLPHRRTKAVDDVKRWRREHPDLYRAQNAINNAVRDGRLKRGLACADCGSEKNVFGIPADVKQPIELVKWQCALCHHRGRFAASPAAERMPA